MHRVLSQHTVKIAYSKLDDNGVVLVFGSVRRRFASVGQAIKAINRILVNRKVVLIAPAHHVLGLKDTEFSVGSRIELPARKGNGE